jgi:hypothetical protein
VDSSRGYSWFEDDVGSLRDVLGYLQRRQRPAHEWLDMLDLTPYQVPLAAMPEAARRVHARGVQRRDFPGVEHAAQVLLGDLEARADGVYRASDGRAWIVCTTALPGVTPAMIDWWFGWHLPASERYRLWHPQAHVAARCKEDRAQLHDDRARYVGNVSYVDEYIGAKLQRLAIEFRPPVELGFTELDAHVATAVCARTVDRVLLSEGGSLAHVVVRTPSGSEMRSSFWLGEVRNRIPLVGSLIDTVVNRPALRARVISDRFLLDLFQHCAEEMNHLPKFLPRLHAERSAD